jgi:GTP-binding protein HflX
VVNKLIAQLAKPGVPVIEAYNKADTVADDDIPRGENRIAISAKTGAGLPDLLALLEQNLGKSLHHAKFHLPYAMAGQIDRLHQEAQVVNVEYTEDGIVVEAICDDTVYGRLREYDPDYVEPEPW